MNSPPPAHAIQHQSLVAIDLLNLILEKSRHGIPADAALQDSFRRHREFGSRDRRLYSNLVFSFFRWKGWTDQAASLPIARRAAAAYRLDFPESHPAVDLLEPPDPPDKPLVSLDAKARQAARWLDLPSPPSPMLLLPAGFPELLALPNGEEPGLHLNKLVDGFQSRPPVWLRIRAHREEQTREICRALGLDPVPHPHLPLAWRLDETARLADVLARCPGCAEIQDVASQAIGILASPAPGGDWWDVCAGSCGKGLHLADLAGGRLTILATDRRDSILQEGAKRARLAGLDRVFRFQKMDVSHAALPGRPFDGVLVDAPCSGTGTWARNPDARWRATPEQVSAYASAQSEILIRVAEAVKPGGVLVYATCSLTAAENTGTVNRFLETRPDFELSPFLNPLTGEPAAGHAFLWPWQGPGSGFFAARLIRKSGMSASCAGGA